MTADGADEVTYNDYETFAVAYARSNETSPFNALYERPAIIALAGDVRGLRVLDAGCGARAHAAELAQARLMIAKDFPLISGKSFAKRKSFAIKPVTSGRRPASRGACPSRPPRPP